ncbi:MAG: hypothetical protein IJ514_07050 [Clostridia bacterium]|nr:hypothetical protein [Clostridia bacterium]
MKTKSQKQFEQEKLIAQTIVDIRTQREDIEKLASDDFEAAVEAVQLGQEDYANELLETIVELEDFVENLKYLEVKIRTAAITAKTLGKLRELPQALGACRNVFCKGPDFKKLGEDMASLLESLGTARDQFKEFRTSLGKTNDPVYAEVFGESRKVTEPKYAQRLEEKKKALEARIIGSTAVSPTPTTAQESVSAEDVAKVDAIAAMLDEEKRRG